MNIVNFSGGKDSTALILWARENLKEFDTVFCDTGWEDSITYEYIEYINHTLLDGKLIVLKSEKYAGFADLSIKKKRCPSTKARFCTSELKMIPLQNYFKSLNIPADQIHSYVGIRADESLARSKMEKINFDGRLGAWIHRPLLCWTAQEVFEMMKINKVEPNPLYKMGMKRVGCMPCIMSGLKEIKQITKERPEAIKKVRELEEKVGRSFFPAKKIPDYACSSMDKNGQMYSNIDDVVNYVNGHNQLELFETPSCMSFYGLCE